MFAGVALRLGHMMHKNYLDYTSLQVSTDKIYIYITILSQKYRLLADISWISYT